MRIETIGNATLYLGDCRDVLPTLSGADAVVTDPPWGLGELRGPTSIERNRNDYGTAPFDDTEEYLIAVILPAFTAALQIADGRGLVTPGCRCMFLYPRPREIGGFYQPAAVGMSSWGFAGYNPVLFYGSDPRGGKGQSSTMTTLTAGPSTPLHPCAKPDKAMEWMVNKATLDGGCVLDPFMGSGTTGVACAKLRRRFIGIEIHEPYFNIACRRIEAAQRQGDLFRDAVNV